MLPAKRTAGGEADDDKLVEVSAVNINLKKPSFTSATVSTLSGNDDGKRRSRSGESYLSRMGLSGVNTDNNSNDINEDLHSHELAVYGSETMRRLSASNVLVSGLQGLGVEIGIRFIYLHFLVFKFFDLD